MFEFSINNVMEKNYNDKRRISNHLLACLLTLIVKELEISVEHGSLCICLKTFLGSVDSNPMEFSLSLHHHRQK